MILTLSFEQGVLEQALQREGVGLGVRKGITGKEYKAHSLHLSILIVKLGDKRTF